MLQTIAEQITTGLTTRHDPALPLDITIICGPQYLLAAITQCKLIKTGEPPKDTRVLEWIAPPLQPRRTIQEKVATLADLIQKVRIRILQVDGMVPGTIWIPISPTDLEWFLLNSPELQRALLNRGPTLVVKPLPTPTLAWMTNHGWISKPKRAQEPLDNALTVFTDPGRKSRKAAITWKDDNTWKHQILKATPEDSLQTLELYAVAWALAQWKDTRLNIVSDSLYVVGVANRIEDATLRDIKNQRLVALLISMQIAISKRTEAYEFHMQCYILGAT